MACAMVSRVMALAIALVGADKSRNVSEAKPLQCLSFDVEVLDTDMAGSLLVEKQAATIDGCCLLCEEEDRCEGFAYSNQMCFLKADFAGTFHKAGVVSRLKKASGSGCVGFAAAQHGKDLVGELLEDWSAPNPEVCCAACADKPDCQGFAFLGERCYLKGDVRGTYGHEGSMVRVKEGVLPEEGAAPALPQCPHFEIEAFDTDMAGALLAEREAATSDGCCPLCEEVDGCEGFAFFEQVCYLKGNFSGTFQKTGVVSRIKRGLGSGCPGFKAAEQGKDLVGELLEAWSAPNPEVCCAACAGRPDCQGFAFLDGRCYLKGSVLGAYGHEGCMIQVKEGVLTEGGSTPVPPQCPHFEMQASDTDMAGALLAAKWAATSDGCCPLCEEVDGCEGFAYFEQVCYLKGNFTGTFHKAGVLSRIKGGLGAGCLGFAAAQEGKDVVGELLDSWYAPKPEACCAACAEKPECQGFAFVGDRCYLKGNVNGTYDHEGCMARIKEGILSEGGGDRRLGDERLFV